MFKLEDYLEERKRGGQSVETGGVNLTGPDYFIHFPSFFSRYA